MTIQPKYDNECGECTDDPITMPTYILSKRIGNMRCSFCSKEHSGDVSLTYNSTDTTGCINNSFCSFECLDRWLWRVGYRYTQRRVYHAKTDIRDGSNGFPRPSNNTETTRRDRRNDSLLQQRPAQAE